MIHEYIEHVLARYILIIFQRLKNNHVPVPSSERNQDGRSMVMLGYMFCIQLISPSLCEAVQYAGRLFQRLLRLTLTLILVRRVLRDVVDQNSW